MLYIIKNSSNETYNSQGGNIPGWTKILHKAKVWKTLPQVKAHLNTWIDYHGNNNINSDWEIIEVFFSLGTQKTPKS
jgi:hypothetical protein